MMACDLVKRVGCFDMMITNSTAKALVCFCVVIEASSKLLETPVDISERKQEAA